MMISATDRAIVRDLAKQAAEIAADPHQDQMRELWRKVNRLERTRPMILLHDATQHETGEKVERACDGDAAWGIEHQLRHRIYHWEHMRDDAIWDDTFGVDIPVAHEGYGIEGDWTQPDHVFGASQINPILNGDEDPAAMIAMPTVTVDWDAAEERLEFVSEVLGDILRVQKRGLIGYWFATVDDFISWRGIENTMMDMVDRPEWLHAWLDRMCEFKLSQIHQYEELGVLSLNNACDTIGSGGIGYTDLLPADDFDGEHVRLKDQWGHATTQIFSEVSPAMHEEFALKYEKRFCEHFGLSNYGCCEPLDLKVDIILKNIPNVRKLSMSPKADVARGAEALGKRAIFSWKPNPAWLGMPTWDIDWQREQMRDAFEKTKGCVVEVIMKDLHTVCGEVNRMWEWVDMARELSQEYA
ncbi:hypothetical protein LCGC14_0015810 [marine sediment metagenome]|uniref:Uroporphyrinogen decarboxylase (URO-D) domain-containing protein n=1 Tax=marine sediment metagenome TaxID=412755 RepID=A0A0F9W409_9ZZZZ|nr:hypothetical protein [Phycisphaerae bacterium]HDZ43556.1 hypothetical protein [Phycisphaerae bacterium]